MSDGVGTATRAIDDDPVARVRFQDACDTVATAAALGMDVPAIAGTSVCVASIALEASDGRYPFTVGIYDTGAAARTAVRNWVVAEWGDAPFSLPWEDETDEEPGEDFDDLRAAWLARHTDLEIIDAYFGGSEDTYSIETVRVAGAPDPLG